jgi:hypothetical protein
MEGKGAKASLWRTEPPRLLPARFVVKFKRVGMSSLPEAGLPDSELYTQSYGNQTCNTYNLTVKIKDVCS